MSPADPAEFHLEEWEDSQATTVAFLPLMDLLERFARYCFQRNLAFVVDSGNLLGAVRHRSVIQLDYDVDLGMQRAQYRKLLAEFEDPPGLRLDLSAYDEPDATICVVPPEPRADDAPYLDLVIYESDGRSTMSEALQRRWPLDHWRSAHSERSWCYDFPTGDLDSPVRLPTWCGLLSAPANWPDRLNRHYDSWHARPESIERAARDLPFDPLVPAVRLSPVYQTLEQGLRDTMGVRPFVARNCAGFP